MRMNKIFTMLIVLLGTSVILNSCSDNDNGYEGVNKAYITAEEGNTLVIGEENQVVNAKLTLTRKVNQTTPVQLKITDNSGAVVDILKITPENISIAADSREVSFKITVKEGVSLVKEKRVKIGIQIQKEIELEKALEIVIKPAVSVQSLTEAQRTLLEGYEAKGLHLTPFLGKVKVATTIISAKDGALPDFAKEFTKEVEGFSVITLSEQATADQPVLKMTENPMGMTEFFYYVMKKETIENDEYWYGEGAGPNYAKVMALINWNKTSEEIFSATLDGIKIKGDKTIDYIGKGKDAYDEDIDVVPFSFTYTAWDRLKKLIGEGNAEAIEVNEQGASSNPQNYLNNTNILTDEYETGAFKASTGSIDYEKGTMTFEFLSSHTSGGDYLSIKVVYSIE